MHNELTPSSGFVEWRARVARRIWERFGVALAEVPELALEDGFASGDTPAEFVAGNAARFEEDDDRAGARFVGHEPTWPPPG